ncbi:hypothetical protein I302_102476 [Kwoniella bestiolae CBS 10118]|uniref:Tubby C-terminal-like domain-containing protein n=1 Tax=Kwoniella bestiolae CBS 10118 TaxID=1296100 RepID=A0A1B9GFB1_9TREE|nr:hypothetical protein I302_01166 [Kwoniella bestiolae CBS 10118]OCF29655.1 hypothetical protein I302_01166 [Kwoniella bestiolae CBS 10118]
MGLIKASPTADLVAVDPPIGLHPQIFAQKATTLVLKEKVWSWTGDDFSVKDIEGRDVVKCHGKAWSLRERKVISDADDKFLFGIRNKILTIHTTFIGEDESEKELFRIRKRLSLGAKMKATFLNPSNGQPITLLLKGDFWGGSADISIEDGPIIAQISRKLLNAREWLVDQQTYFVTIAPGVDLALMAAMCICFDEAMNKKAPGA